MSTKYIEKKSGRGGARKDAGRKSDSGENTKICVSVHEQNWNTALKRWQRYRRQRKPSWLVDGLISYYIKTKGRILEMEAAI
jgi:O-methyltransferase involved in polyketide biosynthesis